VIVLDTNVLSALMRQPQDRAVVAWLDRQPRSSIWTTSVTVLEIRFGLQILAVGKKRSALSQAFEMVLSHDIEGRVAPFDEAAAGQAAGLMASRRAKGRTQALLDTMIAGIVLNSRATLATRNIAHFDDLAVPLVDPWADGP
jgi:predicted nucleic acid-binding protein